MRFAARIGEKYGFSINLCDMQATFRADLFLCRFAD